MIPSFCNQRFTRLRALTKEERGSEVPNWHDAWEEEIFPCSVQPASSSITLDGRVLGVNDNWTVYCNPDTDVKAGDKIVFENQVYLVTNDPRKWQSPTGLVSSLQFTMTKWEG